MYVKHKVIISALQIITFSKYIKASCQSRSVFQYRWVPVRTLSYGPRDMVGKERGVSVLRSSRVVALLISFNSQQPRTWYYCFLVTYRRGSRGLTQFHTLPIIPASRAQM